MIDASWLNSVAPQLFAADRVVLVHGMKGDIMDALLAQAFDARTRARIAVVRPATPEYGTVHAKCTLTFCGDSGCRVLVHSANDIAADWLQRCQGAWCRDFPVKVGAGVRCDFEDMFVDYLDAVAAASGSAGEVVRGVVIPEVRKYDFRGAGCSLVASVPGKHGRQEVCSESRERYGLWRLRSVLEEEDIDESEPAAVAMQFSSLGSIQGKYLAADLKGALFASASRRPDRDAHGSGLVKPSDTLQLVFPTLSQIAGSNEGLEAGASLPVRAANVHRDHIADLLHGWRADGSRRSRAMPHIKSIVRYRRDRPTIVDWLYLGSANLSGAAWGRPRKGRAKAGCAEYLDVWSFELGVLLTSSRYQPQSFWIGAAAVPRGVAVGGAGASYAFEPLAVFQGRRRKGQLGRRQGEGGSVVVPLPLPYSLPPVRYGEGDVPWHVDVREGNGCGRWASQCAAALSRLGLDVQR
jgi:tyrosyl-DNA phosphodiesterase 1